MEPKKIGNRGLLFEFNETNSKFLMPTFTYVIIGITRLYILDTHIGAASMIPIKQYLSKNYPNKEIYIFNSHLHWDHVWGNCAFKDSVIISHEKCYEFLADDEIWNNMIECSSSVKAGDISRTLPNKTFKNELEFLDDDIIFFYSPGHTEDSSSCLDKKNSVLFVGDNVEVPILCLDWHNLDVYIKTLQNYIKLNPKTIIASHNGIISNDEIENNIKYLNDLNNKVELNFNNEHLSEAHSFNQRSQIINKYMSIAKTKLGNKYSLNELLEIFKRNPKATLDEIEKSYAKYISDKI